MAVEQLDIYIVRVDSLVSDYNRLGKFRRVIGDIQAPYAEEVVEQARRRGVLSEEQIQEYLARISQESQG